MLGAPRGARNQHRDSMKRFVPGVKHMAGHRQLAQCSANAADTRPTSATRGATPRRAGTTRTTTSPRSEPCRAVHHHRGRLRQLTACSSSPNITGPNTAETCRKRRLAARGHSRSRGVARAHRRPRRRAQPPLSSIRRPGRGRPSTRWRHVPTPGGRVRLSEPATHSPRVPGAVSDSGSFGKVDRGACGN